MAGGIIIQLGGPDHRREHLGPARAVHGGVEVGRGGNGHPHARRRAHARGVGRFDVDAIRLSAVGGSKFKPKSVGVHRVVVVVPRHVRLCNHGGSRAHAKRHGRLDIHVRVRGVGYRRVRHHGFVVGTPRRRDVRAGE